MTFTLGFSPCPNDTFIFDALVNGKIDTGGIRFEPVLEDVETLNKWALEGKLDITKLSYAVLPLVQKEYRLFNSGSALGRGVGPLLIANQDPGDININERMIAIPGEHTTAHMLFSMAYPEVKNKIFMRYDAIESFVQEGKGLGVIIHENRFTYKQKGLFKITDLGDYWEKQTACPIPLGGIVIRNEYGSGLHQQVNKLIRESIEYAFSKYPVLNDYVRDHAQEMSEDVMRKHIDLYVNEYSLNLGEEGANAVKKMVEVFNEVNHTDYQPSNIFIS
jgi:1,4-dihydroxy-6-naphthoate synthase